MSDMTTNKNRLYWVDAAKGVLIILMAMGHMAQRGDELGITCRAIEAIKQMGLFWSPVFMATFFMISGFWGRYDLKFKDFIVKNAKSLLLPLLVFSYLGGILHEFSYEILKLTYNEGALMYPSLMISLDYWFVLALFIAKCIYWLICKLTSDERLRWAVLGLVYFISVLLLKTWFLPNYACWKWAMVMVVYLPFGRVVFKNLQSWKMFIVAFVLYLAVWLVFYQFDFGFPFTTAGMKNLDLVRAVPSLVLCLAGSFVFLKLCSFIKHARLLELIGRNTLAIYIMHWWIEILVMKVLRSFFSQGVWVSTLAVLLTLATAVFIPCLISQLMNKPKLKWILGK